MNIYKKERPYFWSLLCFKTVLKKCVIKSNRPFSSNFLVLANHSDAVNNKPRTTVIPQFVTKQVITYNS